MKLKGILSVALALIPLSLYAAEYMSAAQEKFKSLDTNHDGYISQTEAKADSLLSQDWSRADVNKNGKIEESEFSAFEESMEPGGVPPKSTE